MVLLLPVQAFLTVPPICYQSNDNLLMTEDRNILEYFFGVPIFITVPTITLSHPGIRH